ncbi:30S ribosomal protein S6e [Candidatus Woesearchaeota archaeon]|nr:30S ribosomal protein S6e [Candidatus Woesearchaeota archaeon]
MAEFKVVISDPKTGLTVQKEVKDPAAKAFLGLKIGDAVKGETIDLQGYEFEITGGSDFCGFPMRKDVLGVGRKRILAYSGVGVRKGEKGMLQRKTVCGNTIHNKIIQVNLKAVKVGGTDIFADAKAKAEKTRGERAAKKAGEKPSDAAKAEAPAAATA